MQETVLLLDLAAAHLGPNPAGQRSQAAFVFQGTIHVLSGTLQLPSKTRSAEVQPHHGAERRDGTQQSAPSGGTTRPNTTAAGLRVSTASARERGGLSRDSPQQKPSRLSALNAHHISRDQRRAVRAAAQHRVLAP